MNYFFNQWVTLMEEIKIDTYPVTFFSILVNTRSKGKQEAKKKKVNFVKLNFIEYHKLYHLKRQTNCIPLPSTHFLIVTMAQVFNN